MLQASEGGRVYLGRSALEIKLRETPAPTALDPAEATPVPMAFGPTERVTLPAPIERPSPRLQPFSADRSADERPEKQILLARSTLIGICLTAFACGIVTTVALDRHHFRALEHELRAHDAEQAALATPPPPPVIEAPAPAPVAPAPVVVQLAARAAAPAEPSKPAEMPKPAEPPSKAAVDSPPVTVTATATKAETKAETKAATKTALATTARVALARTPRPAAAPRPAAHHKSAAETAPDAPAASADWVDPFAE